MNKETIIGIIGSGAMGSGIAQVAATAGHQVILFDVDLNLLAESENKFKTNLEKLVDKGKIPFETAREIIGRISLGDSFASISKCGLIIEAIVEKLDVKQAVFAGLEKNTSADCIIASNTSSLSITSIASSCKIPSRIIGIHFFNPATLMPLVEIIPGLETDPKILLETKSLIDSWGKTTVVAKDSPGFIVNRVARSFYGESIRIYEEGIADFATIDWAMKNFGGFKMGPFELMDFIGNDVNYLVTDTVWHQFFYEPRFKPSLTQKRLYEAKHFGRKSGKGFYDYSEGAILPEPTKDETLGIKIFYRVLAMLINEAADSLYLKLATREDIDTAMMKGVNYPKGLLKWADEIGVSVVYEKLEKLFDKYGEDRYRPCVLLKKMALEGKSFY